MKRLEDVANETKPHGITECLPQYTGLIYRCIYCDDLISEQERRRHYRQIKKCKQIYQSRLVDTFFRKD
jgi:hypothetical protein